MVYVSYTEPVTADEYAAHPDEPWNDHTVDDLIAAEEAEEAAAGPDTSLGGSTAVTGSDADTTDKTATDGTGSTKL